METESEWEGMYEGDQKGTIWRPNIKLSLLDIGVVYVACQIGNFYC